MVSDDSDASTESTSLTRSCITVAVLPEDFAVACTSECTPERCDNATTWPHEALETETGAPGSFQPFKVPSWDAGIRYLPKTPLDLFFRFVSRELVERWAEWTNDAPAPKSRKQYSRSRE